jgi:RNA polymerase sigma-70 factor (ECF subfamily)
MPPAEPSPEGSDAGGFDQVVRTHWGKVYCQVFGYLHDREEAEDITQETFLRAYRGLPQFRHNSSFRTWLYTIAYRMSLNRLEYLRRRNRSKLVSLDAPLDLDGETTLQDTLPADTAAPNEVSVTDELRENVAAAIRALKPRQRELLVLRAVNHLSYEDIAARLQIAVGTVKSRLARSREVLRRRLPADSF